MVLNWFGEYVCGLFLSGVFSPLFTDRHRNYYLYTVSGGMFSIRLSAAIENRIEDKIKDINLTV